MGSSSEDGLSVLLSSLTSAVSALQSSLTAQGMPPFRLDDPTPHPLDHGVPDPVSWYAKKAIIGLCHQMIGMVQSPAEKIALDTVSYMLPASLNVILESNPPIADLIAEGGPNGTDLTVLSKLTGIEAVKLRPIFCLLICEGYFKEISSERYALNRPASLLVTNNSRTMFDLASFTTGPVIGAASAFSQNARGVGLLSGHSFQETAWETFHNLPWYPWLQENKHYLSRFHRGMTQMEVSHDSGIFDDYSWEQLGKQITLVDIGGGLGGLTMELLKRFTGWRAVLQDRAEVIPASKEFWLANAPDIVESGRITFLVHDFFQRSVLPLAAKEAPYVFMIKSVLHNWPDDACIEILKNLSPAAGPGSMLVVINYTPCVARQQSPDFGVKEYLDEISGKSMHEIQKLNLRVPVPLPAGWGYGGAYPPNVSMLMTLLFNARGRTEDEFESLFSTASWKLESNTELRAASSVLKAVKV